MRFTTKEVKRIYRACVGKPLRPEAAQRLCLVFGLTVDEFQQLGLVSSTVRDRFALLVAFCNAERNGKPMMEAPAAALVSEPVGELTAAKATGPLNSTTSAAKLSGRRK